MKGLDLIGELEGELKRLAHVDLALVGIVKGDTCGLTVNPKYVKGIDCRTGPGVIVITGLGVLDHFPSVITSGVYAVGAARVGIGKPSEHTFGQLVHRPYSRFSS